MANIYTAQARGILFTLICLGSGGRENCHKSGPFIVSVGSVHANWTFFYIGILDHRSLLFWVIFSSATFSVRICCSYHQYVRTYGMYTALDHGAQIETGRSGRSRQRVSLGGKKKGGRKKRRKGSLKRSGLTTKARLVSKI